MSTRPFLVIALVAMALTTAAAQTGPPLPTVSPVVESAGVPAGQTLRAALRVRLPATFHVQSNKPRDPSLIPTVLTITPPAGITVGEVVFPPSTDLKQEGQGEPLAVFEENFDIGVLLAVTPGRAPGNITVPARLRYQACDEKMCYIPSTLEFNWTFRVVPAGTAITATNSDVFSGIRFGQGERPGDPAPAAPEHDATSSGSANGTGRLDNFDVLGTTGGYWAPGIFWRSSDSPKAA